MSDFSDSLNALPKEERDLVMKELLMKKLTSKEDLRLWLIYFLKVDLAGCIVSRFSDSSPLDMVWDIYSFCAKEVNDDPMSVIYVAGRASQKTLSSAVLQIILALHFGRSVVHFGGTKDQARRAYTYFKKFVQSPYVKDFLVSEPTQQKTLFRVNNEEIEVEILSISPMAVQGAHAPVVSLDELASLSPDKMLAYEDVSGIPTYTKDGLAWVQFGISSRKGKYTIIETEYEKRKETGMIFKFWTVLENTKRCPDDISGVIPMTYYGDVSENKKLTQAEFNVLPAADKTKYEQINAFDGCFKCPLAVVCGGDAKKQTSTCKTLRPIKSVIHEFKQADLEWFLSQKMSMTPSAEGIVFSKFKRETFEKTPREIYAIFFGKDSGVDITEDQLIAEMVKAGVKRYAGYDYGHTHPMAISIVFEDGQGTCFIMRVVEVPGLEPAQIVELIDGLRQKYFFNVLYPDPSSPAINKMINKVVKVYSSFTKSINSGVQLIRAKLSPTYGPPKLYGLKGNVEPLIKNFEKYHYAYDSSGKLTDTPVKEYDDSIDSLSYAAQNRWQVAKPIMGANGEPPPIDPLNPPKEPQDIYAEKVQKQFTGWLKEEINNSTDGKKESVGSQSSKSKTHFWDID